MGSVPTFFASFENGETTLYSKGVDSTRQSAMYASDESCGISKTICNDCNYLKASVRLVCLFDGLP